MTLPAGDVNNMFAMLFGLGMSEVLVIVAIACIIAFVLGRRSKK